MRNNWCLLKKNITALEQGFSTLKITIKFIEF